MNRKKVIRQRVALARLEASYAEFRKAKEDKKPWESTRKNRKVFHKGRSYEEECARMSKEIKALKEKLTLA